MNKIIKDNFLKKFYENNGMNKEIVIFGFGSSDQNLISWIVHLYEKIKYIIDNNPNVIGGNFYGKEIKEVSELLIENKESILVLIASSYTNEIANQLEMLGFVENINYIKVYECHYDSNTDQIRNVGNVKIG